MKLCRAEAVVALLLASGQCCFSFRSHPTIMAQQSSSFARQKLGEMGTSSAYETKIQLGKDEQGGHQEADGLQPRLHSGDQEDSNHPPAGGQRQNKGGGGGKPARKKKGGGGGGGGGGDLQTVDYTTLALSCRALQAAAVPARFQDAYQLDGQNLAISLRTAEGNQWLHFSWNPKAARVAPGAAPPPGRERRAYSLSQQVKNYLAGLTLVRVGIAMPFERIAVLEFSEGLTDAEPKYRLYLEVMAARSNLILVNAETGSIATCAYQVSPSKSTRPLQTGQQYELPPPQAKAAPAPGAPSLPEFKATVGLIGTDRLASALVSLYKGVSPVLAKGMARAAGLSPNAQVDSLTEEQWEALYSGPWTQWLKVLVENENSQASIDFENFAFQPIIFNDNEAKDLSPHTQKMDLLKAVEDYYGLAQITVEHNRLKQKCLAKVAAALKKARDRQAEFSSRLAEVEAGSARDLEGQADLLTAYTHTWKDGDAEIQCQDFETGEPISITVPTGTTPVEMAQKMYTKSKKLKRSVETVTPLLDQANLLVEYLEGVEFSIFDIETCKSQEDLLAIQEIADELDAEGSGFVQNHLLYINSGLTGRSSSQKTENMSQKKKAQKSQKGKSKKNTKGEAGRQQKGQKPSKKDLSLDGFLKLQRSPSSPVLLVGRNSQQNERLSFKVAREHDVWLHVRGVPGSHCLLRLEPGRDPSPEDLRHAADVAAYHSKARGSSNVPVMYTSPANVKKISGGPPGMVHLMREEVIWADPGRVA